MEIWKDVFGYEEGYQISNIGNLQSLKYRNTGKSHQLKGFQNNSGYLQIALCKNSKYKTYYIHRLVLETFTGKSCLEVNHKNGIKSDNRLENLEYCTHQENMKHMNEILDRNSMKGKLGLLHKYSKKVEQYSKEGIFIKSFFGLHEAGRETGIEWSSIGKCCRGTYKTAGGFIWKYNLFL